MRTGPASRSSIHRRWLASSRWSRRTTMSKRDFIGLLAGWSASIGGVFLVAVLVRVFG